MPCAPLRRAAAGALVASAALVGLAGAAAEPAAPTTTKPDWARLDGLLWAGDYERAAAAADELAQALKPRRRDPDFVSRSLGFARALMRQGVAAERLGRLDDAATAFDEAYRTLRDADFKRLVSLEERSATAANAAAFVLLQVDLVELLDLRMALILDQLRSANPARDAAADPAAAAPEELRGQVEEWLKDFKLLEKVTIDARKTLAERLAAGDRTLLTSPYRTALAGPFRPTFVAGIKALELALLPFDASSPPTDGAAVPLDPALRRTRLEDAVRLFDEASRALDEAIATAAPKGAAAMSVEARIEAALMRAELLTWQGAALLASGDASRGRECGAKAVELRREAAVLRKLPQPDAHPDLFVPLLLSAEATLAAARSDLDAGDSARSRDALGAAAALLARADALAVPASHPLRTRLSTLQERLGEARAAVDRAIPGTDAADTAARRIRRAIDRTAASAVGPVP